MGLSVGPIDTLEMPLRNERRAAAVHPDRDRRLVLRVGSGQGQVGQMWHECFASLLDFLRDFHQVESQADVAAELVAEDIERRFQNSQMAETVPHSRRMRSTCGPKAVKYSIIAIPLFTKARLLRNVTACPRSQKSDETRGSHVS